MKRTWTIAAAAAALLFPFAASAFAFDCPNLIKAAEAEIDRVSGMMKGETPAGMTEAEMANMHALLDDAKMLLDGARHNHDKPQSPMDHARSMAKADSAKAFALAAEALHRFHAEPK